MDLEKIGGKFINWTKNKIRHHIKDRYKKVYFREKEVWWTALGKNVGYEADGKHTLFERPVLILKKYSADMYFALPLTSQIKNPIPWYQIVVELNGSKSAVNITQGRAMSKNRLLRKINVLDSESYYNIVGQFIDQFKQIKK